ncbi:putative cellobiohydrolase [Aspergillus fischeri NRRL 181]|uniref:Probable 1,4-beta-D-glucan cellobiohydrolase C n=1 Tax=Neosartorya fischeri (strain ATCC 1020 / DSM 3700 / CBS 544.65 / FGSC A1164 / JCM 1740 / NRRL 181 / WB 181) TaxID=331117 RepID=CBHC_NEOFI|nr:cellobiohydrolase, putative [Aspergillus fischeri NRRL 181]A1DJQ7.1 RecName: Full=Probable 1,4-beta-D-glucan cellobiohydrolase C; AltName: Full=Beta-glucancellobiohydrolase C; AltName: Full=Exocellobiohydrolase C; AltName: Full=Exoglucanase C; Flags: Precursor [Aspergillus fischeri NRRL 181]EAW16946.1 cellobiohydrolase, putative [Aspergillus fischeri NRRL 181]
MKHLASSIALTLLLPAVQAQQTVWGQCGGQGWSGPTNCVAGAACSTLNPYYAQCIPGATATSTTLSTTTTTQTTTKPTTTGPTTSAPTVTASGNPFSGYQLYANPYYSSEVHTLAMPSLPSSLQPKASAVAEVPSFVWLDVAAKVPTMGTYLADIQAKNKAGASPPIAGIFVVYDLPDRDCAALASNGEYSIANNGVANYKAYIDAIRAQLVKYSDVHTILVIEPDSLANLVTNLNVAKCANAQSAYLECVDYALKQLNLPNVAMYLDAGHAGWLGWPANLGPAATLFAKVYTDAGSPAALRGLATNVANYNAWSLSTCPSYTQGDPNCDEKKYINAMAPLLKNAGFDAHFIMDTSRNGVQPTKQSAWGDWCNVIGTGFGVRPSTNTGDPLQDAFVWIKPGGESDGTSNSSSARYDAHCGYSDALQPAPEAGTWFQAYFEQLLTNANPSF